jgi:hypothetical protein
MKHSRTGFLLHHAEGWCVITDVNSAYRKLQSCTAPGAGFVTYDKAIYHQSSGRIATRLVESRSIIPPNKAKGPTNRPVSLYLAGGIP